MCVYLYLIGICLLTSFLRAKLSKFWALRNWLCHQDIILKHTKIVLHQMGASGLNTLILLLCWILISMLLLLSKEHSQEFDGDSALQELYDYVRKYQDQVIQTHSKLGINCRVKTPIWTKYVELIVKTGSELSLASWDSFCVANRSCS